MTRLYSHAAALLMSAGFMVSCAKDSGNQTQGGVPLGKAEVLYRKAKAADDKGKLSSAIKGYGKVADKYPLKPSGENGRFRQAELQEKQGEAQRAFDTYQKFIQSYQGSSRYSDALQKQVNIAQGAADGTVRNSFLGLKSKLDEDKVIGMLGKVRDNAPRSETAAKAQFTIGDIHQKSGSDKEAISAYRKLVKDQPDSKYAPEALFRVGGVFMAAAEAGNHNRANINLAIEAFDDYLLQYKGHGKNAEARRLSKNLRDRDLEGSLDIAEFYDKTGQHESAKVYYREVLKNSKSGPTHNKAKARLKELGE